MVGVPIEFESELFRGKFLLRLRNAQTCEHPDLSEAYFAGRKRLLQYIIQGRFLVDDLSMAAVHSSVEYERKLAMAPPPFLDHIIQAIFRRTLPGIFMDLTSDRPKITVMLAGSAQQLAIHAPGQEPDILRSVNIEENTTALSTVWTAICQYKAQEQDEDDDDNNLSCSKLRRRHLSNPENAKKYKFDTDFVYTFHMYDDFLDYANYQICLPMGLGTFDLARVLGGQPSTFAARVSTGGPSDKKKHGDGKEKEDEGKEQHAATAIFNFPLWHENLL